jgi:Fe-Mn family superoxide dismutase
MKFMGRISRRSFLKSSVLGIASFSIFPGMIFKDNFKKTSNNFNYKGETKAMAYEWKFNPRPYSDEEAKSLLKDVMSTETSDWHYNTHQKGYVTFLNNIEKELETADRSKANGNYSLIGELKRRTTWNHGGALLHDLYWQVLGGDGDSSKGKDILEAINKEYGSFDKWKEDFKASALAAKLSGWGVLVYDQLYSGRLLNILVDEHHYGAIWGGIPLIACDVFEHAYYHKDGPGRAKYIDNFINNLHWGRINDRFTKFVK